MGDKMIDGNMVALDKYLREQAEGEEQTERWSEFVGWVKGDISNIIDDIEGYDAEDLKEMSDRLDQAIEALQNLIGELEGER